MSASILPFRSSNPFIAVLCEERAFAARIESAHADYRDSIFTEATRALDDLVAQADHRERSEGSLFPADPRLHQPCSSGSVQGHRERRREFRCAADKPGVVPDSFGPETA